MKDRTGELRLDEMMKSIDVLGRLAFGGQCIAAMAILAGPALFITAAIIPFFAWDDNQAEALVFWLGGWLLAIAIAVGGVAFGLFCWRWSGDWITEWPGYAVGFSVAAVACAVLAWLITSTPIPVYVSIAATTGAAFLIGFLVAGHLAGTQVLEETRQQQRQSSIARRR